MTINCGICGNEIPSHMVEDIKSLISNLHAVIKEAENNKIVIESGEPDNRYIFKSIKFGRHNNSYWTRLHIPNIDVCAKCFKWFEKESISLGSLDTVIPNLNLKELNKDIWNDIKNCGVKIELSDW